MGSDDAETVRRIRETVMDVLEEMDMAGMVRAAAAERLGMDLSVQHRKELVRSVIDSFLDSLDCDGGEAAATVGEEDQAQLGEEKEMEVGEKEEGGDERVLERREDQCDEAETMKRIVETVWVVLKGTDASCVTEAVLYAAAAERLGMDLSVHPRKKFVQCVIDSFLSSLDCDEKRAGVVLEEVKRKDQTQEEEEEEMEVEKKEEGIRRVLGKGEDQGDDAETMKRIERTVREILKGADLYSMTDAMVHAAAAERLGMDLSVQHRKDFVQSVIDSYLDCLDIDKEKATVVQEEAREVQQDKAQEGNKRKRTRPRVRRRRSKMTEQGENTETSVVVGAVQKAEAAREKEQNKVHEGGRRRRRWRSKWSEQNGCTVHLVKGGSHYRFPKGGHPLHYRRDDKQLPTSKGITFMM